MRSSISVLTFDDTGRVLDYRPSIPPFRFYFPPDDTVGLIELAPRRLDRFSLEDEKLSVRLPSELAQDAGFTSLEYQPPEGS